MILFAGIIIAEQKKKQFPRSWVDVLSSAIADPP